MLKSFSASRTSKKDEALKQKSRPLSATLPAALGKEVMNAGPVHVIPSAFVRDVCFASVDRDKNTALNDGDGLSKLLAQRRRVELEIASRNKYIKGDKDILDAINSASTHLQQLIMENQRLQDKNSKNNEHINYLKKERDQWRSKFRKEAINRGTLYDLRATKQILQRETIDARSLVVNATKASRKMLDAVEHNWIRHKKAMSREIEEYRMRHHAQLLWSAEKIAEAGREDRAIHTFMRYLRA